MLQQTKNVIPTIVADQNDLIKAMKNNDKVIYIRGELYKQFSKKVTGSKVCKATKGFGKVGIGVTMVTALIGGPATLAALAVGAGIVGLSKYQDDFDKYSPIDNKQKQQIELYRSKGKNKFNKDTDKIVGI